MRMTRRTFLRATGGAAALATGVRAIPAHAQKKQVVTIAFPETVTSMDPHAAPRNSPRESLYEAVFDRFLQQDRQGKYGSHIIESWQWTDGKMGMAVKVRQGVKFHDGSDLTAEDVAFSMNRLKEVSIYKATYAKVKEYQVRDKATLQLVFERFDPSFPRWLGFLAGFVVPQGLLPVPRRGRQGAGRRSSPGSRWARAPTGWSPSPRAARSSWRRSTSYWKGAPPIKRAVFKMVTDPTARVAEIVSGNADITSEVPVEEFGRLSTQPTLKGVKQPVADMAQIFLNPRFEPFKKEEVRLAVHYAIDKKAIVEKVLLGFGMPLSLTEAPLYDAYDPSFSFPYDPAKARQLLQTAGYSASSPLRLKVMTTRGVRAKDFEFMSAITQMWKDVGIDGRARGHHDPAVVPVPDRPRAGRAGPRAAVPLLLVQSRPATRSTRSASRTTSRGRSACGSRRTSCPLIDPIFDERDEPKRIAAAKKAARYIVEKGYVVPLFQVVQPVVMKKDLAYTPFPTGVLVPQEMSWM